MSANTVIRSYEAKVDDVRPDERAVISKIGGMAIDRHRTIISHRGISLDAYRLNPIVLHEHGRCPTRGSLPVGRNQWIKIDGDRMIAKTIFRDDAYSSELFNAYKDEWMRGWSINVLSHEASPPTDEEMRSIPALRHECDLIYRKTELVEYSTTSMPSHRDALTIMVSRGIWVPEESMAEAERREATTTVNVPADIDRTTTDSQGGLSGGGATVKPGTKGRDDEGDEDDGEDEGPSAKANLKPRPKPGNDGAQADEPDEDEDEDHPRTIRKKGSRYVIYSESGKKLGDYATREEAEHRLGQIEYFKHEGVRSAPGPDSPPPAHDPADPVHPDGHGGWRLRGLDGPSFPDEASARRALEQLTNPASFDAIFKAQAQQIDRRNAAIQEAVSEGVRAIIDLQQWGIV